MKINTIKAIDDWTLDVLGVPFGGPQGGKDLEGEWFSSDTNLHLDQFGNPMILYYHGHDPDGTPQGDPEIIGKALSYEQRSDGVWWRVALDKTSEYAHRVWSAAQRGFARASSGSIAHLTRKAEGHILNWPVVELSIFDLGDTRIAANNYAVALPAAKAIYAQAGRILPEIDEFADLRARAIESIESIDHLLEQVAGTDPGPLEELMETTARALIGRDDIKVRLVKPGDVGGRSLSGVCKWYKDDDTVILVDPGMSMDRQYKTLLHEISHGIEHDPVHSPVLAEAVQEWEADEYVRKLDVIADALVENSGSPAGDMPTVNKLVNLREWALDIRKEI